MNFNVKDWRTWADNLQRLRNMPEEVGNAFKEIKATIGHIDNGIKLFKSLEIRARMK